jgi:methyl-accepting chemotaxis protein
VLLWIGPYPGLIRVTLGTILFGLWLGVALALRDRVIRPLQTVSNLLAALREDDFSIRARGAMANDALGQVMLEVNTLAETLRSQRLGAQEATVLLRAVMAEIDVRDLRASTATAASSSSTATASACSVGSRRI